MFLCSLLSGCHCEDHGQSSLTEARRMRIQSPYKYLKVLELLFSDSWLFVLFSILLSLIPYPLSLIPYALSLIPYPLSLVPHL